MLEVLTLILYNVTNVKNLKISICVKTYLRVREYFPILLLHIYILF